MSKLNVCFFCNEVPDIKTCNQTDCFAYGFRKSYLQMDDEANERRRQLVYQSQVKLGIRMPEKMF